MNQIVLAACSFLVFAAASLGASVDVRNDADLAAALSTARPGDEIRLASGTYRGGIRATLTGEKDRPIVLTSADPKNPAVIEGRSGMQLARSRYVTVSHLHIRGAATNGMNIDDGGGDNPDQSAVGITVRNCRITDTGPRGNTDGLKLSGLRDFRIIDCEISGWGGSAIDMVGCADGVIEGCVFTGKAGFDQSNGVQMKGGSHDIVVKNNRFDNAGQRSLNIGGSTGVQFFRPRDASYEAKDITVEHNHITGSDAAAAFVGVDGAIFRHNTIRAPGRWVFRILQESRDARFVPCRNVKVERNVIEYSRQQVRTIVNIGGDTQPETFTFNANWWWCTDGPTARPSLPTPETDGIYGRDPKDAGEAYGAAAPPVR